MADLKEEEIYRVVVNAERQYSIWPVYKENPTGTPIRLLSAPSLHFHYVFSIEKPFYEEIRTHVLYYAQKC